MLCKVSLVFEKFNSAKPSGLFMLEEIISEADETTSLGISILSLLTPGPLN